MVWTIRLMYAILLTSITGSILFGAWYTIGRILEKMGYIKVMYKALRISLLFWIIPLSFLLLDYVNGRTDQGGGFVFFYSDSIDRVSRAFVAGWLIVVISSFAKYLWDVQKTSELLSDSFECEKAIQEKFESVREEFGIKKDTVRLMQSYAVETPLCEGILHPRVVIPVARYSEEELRVIFVHELNHYLQRDIWYKHLAFIATCIHCFNPLIYALRNKLDEWGEYYCDYDSIKVIGSSKLYFTVVLDMATDTEQRFSQLYAPLFEKKSEILKRIEHIKWSKGVHCKKIAAPIICIFAMLFSSTALVFGATYEAKEIYLSLYSKSVYEVKEVNNTVDVPELEEVTLSGSESNANDVAEEFKIENEIQGGSPLDMELLPNSSLRSEELDCISGDEIDISLYASPKEATVRVGLICPDGTKRYVSGENILIHCFKIYDSGKYRLYVENGSSEESIVLLGGITINHNN